MNGIQQDKMCMARNIVGVVKNLPSPVESVKSHSVEYMSKESFM